MPGCASAHRAGKHGTIESTSARKYGSSTQCVLHLKRSGRARAELQPSCIRRAHCFNLRRQLVPASCTQQTHAHTVTTGLGLPSQRHLHPRHRLTETCRMRRQFPASAGSRVAVHLPHYCCRHRSRVTPVEFYWLVPKVELKSKK